MRTITYLIQSRSPEAASTATLKFLTKHPVCARAGNKDAVRKFIKGGRVLKVLHSNPTSRSIFLQNHRFNKPCEHRFVYEFAIENAQCILDARSAFPILEN